MILFQPKLITKYQIKKEEIDKNNNVINVMNILDKNYLYFEKYNNNKEKLIKKYSNKIKTNQYFIVNFKMIKL